MLRLIILFTLLTATVALHAEGNQETIKRVRYKYGPAYIYRVTLVDKQGTTGSLEHPTRFLSRRSVERRKRQGLAVDSTDLPVSARYLRLIEKRDVDIIGQSRWQNTVLVRLRDSLQIHAIEQLPCVRDTRLVWLSPDSVTPSAVKTKYHDDFEEHDSVGGEPYGTAAQQIRMLQGHRLHDIGLRGEGMMIAVLDGGFKNADKIPACQHIDIRGWRDFVTPASPSIFSETDHGTRVLTTMAVNVPYYYIGTAPKASYWLLRSEDQQTEQEVEEDYWTMAAEFADSVGCDLINSSLGYTEYDHPQMNYRQWQLDGRTAFVSRSASMLASKGIILCNSAGNSGMNAWKKITVPADATDILTIGAVNRQGQNAAFASVGPSHDNRVKPDVAALGSPVALISGRGTLVHDMGTSFSTPIVCGIVACLWQGLPGKTAREIMELVRRSASQADDPDNILGYGIPDFWQALMIGGSEK
jgi:subtilisin family serine protease